MEIVLGQPAQFAPHHVSVVPYPEDFADLAKGSSELAEPLVICHEKSRFAHDDSLFADAEASRSMASLKAKCRCHSPPERLVGFAQRLLPGHADIPEQMRVVGDVAERRALSTPGGPSPQGTPCGGRVRSPV
ncbi:hypothetical protein [Bradyrhizobium jicamae]|uniref:hypothetical protein n=1 Tax=Bradyrhizobium jicamae TaxID=280332 RepID=UPI0039083382